MNSIRFPPSVRSMVSYPDILQKLKKYSPKSFSTISEEASGNAGSQLLDSHSHPPDIHTKPSESNDQPSEIHT